MPLNVQHDCVRGKCLPEGTRSQVQEREETARTVKIIRHTDNDHFVVNMHVLHHAHFLHQFFPPHLQLVETLQYDRKQFHDQLAAQHRDNQQVRQACKHGVGNNQAGNEEQVPENLVNARHATDLSLEQQIAMFHTGLGG